MFEVANLDRAGGAQIASLMFEVAGFDKAGREQSEFVFVRG